MGLDQKLPLRPFLPNDSQQLSQYIRQIFFHNLPHNVQINVFISVDETVACPDDIVPGNLGMRLSGLLRDLGSSLADDFNETHRGQGQLLIAVKVPTRSPLSETQCLLRPSTI